MYNTVKEMHIALDMGLQQIDSNRKQSISPEHKDMALNYAVLQFVETRTNPKTNIKREGFEDTQKRYDDIRDLKRSKVLSTYALNSKVFSILPFNYYKQVSIGAGVVYSKSNLPEANDKDKYSYNILHFPDDNNTSSEKYNDFIIKNNSDEVLFSINNYLDISTFYSSDSKFMIINLVLEEVNKMDDIKIYWETWNNVYKPNSFIIVSKSSIASRSLDNTYTLTYGYPWTDDISGSHLTTSNSIKHSVSYLKYPSTNNKNVPVDLYSSENEFDVLGNPYYQKNKHLNPSGYIENNRVIVYNGDNFVIPSITLNYIKKPRLINLKANQSCEIEVNREIVDLAIQKLKAYIIDEGYQHIVNESQIIE